MTGRARTNWGQRARVYALGSALLLATASASTPSFAQNAGVQVQTQVTARQVEAGEVFQLQLSASSNDGSSIEAPQFSAPAGMALQGPSLSTRHEVSIGASIQRTRTVTATWSLQAQKPGTYTLGAPSLLIDGRRVQGQAVSIVVTAPDPNRRQAPSNRRGRQRGSPLDPLDLFGRGFPFDFGNLDQDPFGDPLPQALPPVPEEYRVERAPDPIAFLRASVDRRRVVVGQQVTLNIYAYGAHGPFKEVNPSEPGRTDFLSYAIVEGTYGQQAFQVPIASGPAGSPVDPENSDVWIAVKARQLALFPIRAGKLSIGSMSMGFFGRRYSRDTQNGLPRRSEEIILDVVEPPLKGRPTGYKVGDVGSYTLSAKVEPRQVKQGDSISVVARLEGEGNLPYKLRTPQQNAVEWLEPSLSDDVKARDGVVSGFRVFNYVVRLDRAGDVDLGSIALPFWNPKTERYELAKADLGHVEVLASSSAQGTAGGASGAAAAANAADAAATTDQLQALLLTPRASLSPATASAWRLGERQSFWYLLGLGPLAVVCLDAGTRLGRKLQGRLSARRQTPANLARQALDRAQQAATSADPAAVASAVERAVFLAIESASGVRARAILKDQLKKALLDAGLSDALASRAQEILNACDALRFGAYAGSPAELVNAAESSVSALLNAARPGTKKAAP